MSLKIWLPLNGDLTNNGVDNSAITNTSATFNDNGKVGKCAYFNGSAKIQGTEDYTGWTEYSLAFWFKVASAPSTWSTLVTLGKSNGWANEYFTTTTNGSNVYTSVANGSSYSNTSTSYTAGQWNHVAATYKSRTLKLYLNGTLAKTVSASFDPTLTSSNLFSIGRYSNNAEPFTGYINDVRLYDHCLSDSEIHELSLGLIAHYKLDCSVNAITNAYSSPTFNTSAAAGGWNHWGQSGASGTFGQNIDKTYIYDKNQTYSHWWADASGATGNYLLYQSPAFAGGYRSLSAIMKEENSKPITESIAYPTWNARDGGAELNKWTRVVSLGDGFYLCQVDGVHQDGSNDLIGFYIKAGYKVYVSQAWLENDKECCSDVLFPLTQAIDSSGYERNGTPNGGILLSVDTPRYSNSLKFNGSTGYITADNAPFSNSTTEYSMSCWFNPTGSHQGAFFSNRTTADLRGIAIFYSNGKLLIDFGSRWTIDNPSIVIGSWNHIVVSAKLNGTSYCYVNGIEIGTNTFSTAPTLANASWFSVAGSQGSSTAVTGNYINGFLSDFRLYATALTADDAKKLYNLGMKVDNAQDMHGLEYEETAENLLRTEVIQPYAKSGSTVGIGEWVTRNGVYAMDIRPAPFYNNITVDGVVKSAILRNELEPNTQYVLDLWIDADDVKNNGTNVAAGLTIAYTDNTTTQAYVTGGNKGFQHKLVMTDASKSVDRIMSYYYVSQPTYYRYDSYIAKVTNTTGTLRTGITRNGQCVDGGDNLAKIGADGTMHAKEFLEI